MKQSKTIVFVHGLFVNNQSWSEWKNYFESLGYTCHTPANPFHEGDPAFLRNNISPQLNKTGFEDVVNNIVKIIDSLPEKPIVIGHSLAGLVVQKLIELDKAVAGVSINGAPPKNIFAPFQTIKTVFPVVNFFKSDAFMGSREWYHHAFFNNFSREESDREFNKIAVPESRTIARDTLLKSFAKIDLEKKHAPLLFVGGGKDNIFPAAFTEKIARSYSTNSGVTDVKIFPERSHYTCGEPGWEEVAAYVENWLQKTAAVSH